MASCQVCDLQFTAEVESPLSPIVEFNLECCEQHVGEINFQFIGYKHVIDETCRWNDNNKWEDEKKFFTDCRIDISIGCVPETLDDLCYYETTDKIPYAFTNQVLLGACL